MADENGVLRLDPRVLKRFLGSIIEVHLVDGKVIRGRLVGLDSEYFNLLLEEAETRKGVKVPAALVLGASISCILFLGPPRVKGRKPREPSLKTKVIELLKSDPNLDAETIARLCNADVDDVKRIISSLRQKGFASSGER